MTEIPVDGHGKFYLATVIDLYSRRCLAASTSHSANATLARAAIQTAVAARGGPGAIRNVIFHTDYSGLRVMPRNLALPVLAGVAG